MKLVLLIFLILSSFSLVAQTEFLDTQSTANTPFQIPFRVGTTGSIAFIETPDAIMIGPAIGASYTSSIIEYINPVRIDNDSSLITPITKNRGWMEIRRRRYDGGLGLAAIIGDSFTAGLVPFKGAMQTTVKMKEHKDEVIPKELKMPIELKQLESWRVGDQGSYQMYGGVEVMASFGVSIVNLARTSIAFQNQFIVDLRKANKNTIVFSIAEEKLQRSETSVGPLISKATLALFQGKRLSSEFVLNLDNPKHHELYKRGLAGKINELQVALDNRSQKLKWMGASTSFYLGIPYLIGVEKSQGRYSITTNETESDMSIKNRFNRGVFATEGEHNRLVYRTDEVVLLLWNSQMKKAHDNVMEKYFFRFGRSIGIKGFNDKMPEGFYGSVITQIGLALLKEEMLGFKEVNQLELATELSKQCEILKLKCAQESKLKSILKNFVSAIALPWEKMSFELGKQLMKNPVLIHSLLKVSEIKKEVYVKFLNDNYQSVEGMLEVE